MTDDTSTVMSLGPHLFDDQEAFTTVDSLPPFATFWGEPTMTYAHLSGPVGAPGEIALWACDRDGFEYVDLPAVESAVLFEGVAKLTDAEGCETVVRAGEGYRLPLGWSGRFEAVEPVKKVFFVL